MVGYRGLPPDSQYWAEFHRQEAVRERAKEELDKMAGRVDLHGNVEKPFMKDRLMDFDMAVKLGLLDGF